MKTHNDDKPFKCNNCNKEFRRKEDLKKHVYSCKKVVPNMQEENNKVLEPGIRLREEGINLVNSEESILKTCDICLKSFANKADLNAHAKTHQLPLSCLICHKGFARKDSLIRHSLLHDNEKSYECSSCDESFKRKDHLFRHIKTHQSNKQLFSCDYCGKSYTLNHNLQAHMKNNHHYSIPGQGFATSKEHIPNRNNVKCQYCAKIYSTKQEAKKHEQNYHKPNKTSNNVINFGDP